MRIALAVALLVLVVALPAAAAPRSVVVVGDSLVVGTTPYLKRELGGVSVASDGRVGRPSSEAVGVLRRLDSGQQVVVFDAGVNDDPSQPGRLSSDLAAARSIAGGRCIVVATMSRPPYRGVSVDGLNRAVRSFASSTSNARLVDWRGFAVSHPRLIAPDGVHPTSAGYAARAKLFASVIASCGGGGAPPSGSPPSVGGLPPAGTPPPRGKRPRDKDPAEPEPQKPKKKPRPKPTLGGNSSVLLDEPVTIQSRGARLKGELLAPAAGGRHPAVVMIHGAGHAVREQYRSQAEYLAEHGVAALIYDKRGSGESSGDPDYRYSQLEADARAAVAFLRTRSEVDPEGIGLWGLSEGASIAPMVAAGNPQVAAVMVVSPIAVARARQREWAVRRALESADAGAGATPVSRYYSLASDDDLRLDPAPSWRHVAQPVLAVWGAADVKVPVHASASALAAALSGGDVNRDRTFRTFPAANHELGVTVEAGRPGSAPGFMELSARWLRDHLGATKPPPPVVSTPVPPAAGPPVLDVERASFLEHWPVQLLWLIVPAVALAAFAFRRRGEWWWLGGVVALDLLALAALAFSVATIVDVDGEGVEAAAGMPVVLLVTWVLTLAAAGATAAFAWRRRSPAALASAAWLLLLAYWLV